MRRSLAILLLLAILATPAAGASATPHPEIVAVYPDPVADGDPGEFVLVDVPPSTNLSAYTLTDGESTVALPDAGPGQVALAFDTDRPGYHYASFHHETDEKPFGAAVEFARRVEDAGFDWFSVMDHLWQLPFVGERTEPFFDCYTTLPAIAQATDSVEISALVTSVHYRNPALLGRILATLDHVSHGRAVLGIGAGWFEEEYDAYGYEFPDAPERISQLADAIELIRTTWTDAPATYDGEHYAIEDLILESKPVQDPHPPILVGGGGEQLTLRVAACHADRWNVPGASPEAFEHKLGVLEEHCADVGRDVSEIEPSVLQTAVIRETTEAAHEAYERIKAETDAGVTTGRDEYRGLVGTAVEVIERLETFENLGAEMVMLRAESNDPETVDALFDEVAPAVR